MTKTYENGLLTIVRDDGKILKQERNPATGKPWASEAEAFAFTFDGRYPWLTEAEWAASDEPEEEPYKISPAVFQLLFTFDEMAFIESMIETDAAIRRLDKLLTQGLDYVDMRLPIVTDGVRYILDKMVEDPEFVMTQEESDIRHASILAVTIPGTSV